MMTSTTQQLTFRDDNAAQTNRYGTLMAIDAVGKRALVRLKDRRGRMTDLWVNYLALQPNVDGSYAMRCYETRGFRQNSVPTPYHNTVWREHDRGRIEQWDPARLDGAVIASQAGKGHNRLDTGTLGWRDIHNQAAFKAEHSGGSFSNKGPVGKDLLTNVAGGMLSGANNSRHDEGITQSRISEGTLIIRDQGRQQQDVAQLERETGLGNAGSISPLFDKEKEQSRLKQAQLIDNLGAQAMVLIRVMP